MKIFDLRLIDATSVQGLFVQKHVGQSRMSSMNSLDWFLKNNFHRVVISLSFSLSLSNDSNRRSLDVLSLVTLSCAIIIGNYLGAITESS